MKFAVNVYWGIHFCLSIATSLSYVGSPHTIYRRPNEILTSIARFNLCFPAIQTNPPASIRQSSFLVSPQGLVGRLSSVKYFASRAVTAGLSGRDAKDALHVVRSVLHLGLGNTLVRPETCSYSHQNMHRKLQCCCCCALLLFFISDMPKVNHFGCLVV
jgi:hypothetical protein